MSKKAEYFNFPVELLAGFLKNSDQVLKDIIHYSIYTHACTLTMGTETEKVIASSSYFNTSLGSTAYCIRRGKELTSICHMNSPKTGIYIPMYWEYLNNEKTEFEKASLLCFLAIKSILGTKAYCKVTNLYLWSRMDGKANAVTDVNKLSSEVKKFANRYQTEKIKEELIFNWSLIHYSQFTRGFYVSFKLSLEDLIFEAEQRRKSIKQKQQKQLLNEAKQKALERLKKTSP